jgi:hypothetical protein
MKTCLFSSAKQSRSLDYSIGAGETARFDLFVMHSVKDVMNMCPEIEPISSLEE